MFAQPPPSTSGYLPSAPQFPTPGPPQIPPNYGSGTPLPPPVTAAPAANIPSANQGLGYKLGSGIKSLGQKLGDYAQLTKGSATGKFGRELGEGLGMSASAARKMSRASRLGLWGAIGYGGYQGLKHMLSDEQAKGSAPDGIMSKEEMDARQKVSATVLKGMKYGGDTTFSKKDMEAFLAGQPANVKQVYDKLRADSPVEGKKYTQFDKDVHDAATGNGKSVLDIYNAIRRGMMASGGDGKVPDVIYLPRRYRLQGADGPEFMVAIDAKTDKQKPRMVYMPVGGTELTYEFKKPE